jgi:TonB-dependent receptor
VSESWAGGVQPVDNFATSGPNNVEEYTFDDFFGGNGLQGENTFLFPNIDVVRVENYDNFHNRIAPVNTANNWNSLGNRPNALPNSLFLPTEVSVNRVESQAIYARLDFGSDDYAKRFSGNVGLRYVSYDWDLTGGVTFPNSQPSTLDQFFSADDIAFSTGGLVPDNTTTDEFDAVLPSFNLKVELNEDLIARIGASKAVALPDLRDKRNSLTVSRQVNVVRDPVTGNLVTADIVGYSGGGGNPGINPIESVNLDASLEWYFADAGSLTASVFHKDVEGFYRFGPTSIQATNNGVTRDVLINGPINGEDATIKGFEIAYTQFYDFLPAPFDGIGLQANYTYIDSDGSSSTADALSPEGGLAGNGQASSLGVFSGLPLEGLSQDTINLILMYEKGPISARLAYNYRSEYLLNTRDVITFVPNVAEATDQIDASIRYNFSERFTVGLEMNNLGDEVNELSQVFTTSLDQAPRSFFVNDRRFTLTLSGSF